MRTIRHTKTLFDYDGSQVFEARDAIDAFCEVFCAKGTKEAKITKDRTQAGRNRSEAEIAAKKRDKK